MSFFIDEINIFSSIDLFKVKPDYQVRDEIETKISTILPYKHTIIALLIIVQKAYRKAESTA